MKTHYELLHVDPDAPPETIKKAFRREIARYHPDKVQHLGPEFQEIASARAAELTEAYRVLMDGALRAEYDAGLQFDAVPAPAAEDAPAARTRTSTPAEAPPAPAPEDNASRPDVPPRRTADSTPLEFVRKVGTSRLRDAVSAVSEDAATVCVRGFDAAYDIRRRARLFQKTEPPVRLLMKFVPVVDGQAITTAWPDALRAAGGQEHVSVVLLLGSAGFGSARELSSAITEQRRKTRGTAPIVVPVDVRDWEALFPPDTPASVRSIMQWLRQASA